MAIATGSEFRETHLNLAKAQSSQRKAGKRWRGVLWYAESGAVVRGVADCDVFIRSDMENASDLYVAGGVEEGGG
jgi:hypothetical protein